MNANTGRLKLTGGGTHTGGISIASGASVEVASNSYDFESGSTISGSGTLVRAMLEDGLVDELHLFVYPLTRGSGPRLFPEDAPPRKLSLARCESYDNGVVYVAYVAQD